MTEATFWVAAEYFWDPRCNHELLGVQIKEPRDLAREGCGSRADRLSLQNSDSSPAESRGRVMGERMEEEQRHLSEIKGASSRARLAFPLTGGRDWGEGGGGGLQ